MMPAADLCYALLVLQDARRAGWQLRIGVFALMLPCQLIGRPRAFT